jgi:hypothetical protein
MGAFSGGGAERLNDRLGSKAGVSLSERPAGLQGRQASGFIDQIHLNQAQAAIFSGLFHR